MDSESGSPVAGGYATGGPTPDVSIVLVTKNGERYLEEVLQAIASQGTGRIYEIVAVDSGSTDGTLEILRRHRARMNHIKPDDFNHGETRNLGARLSDARSRYLVYLTQDATPAPGWLEALIRPMEEDERIAGAFSRQLPRPDCNPALARLMTTRWEQVGTPGRVVKKVDDVKAYQRNRAGRAFFANTSSAIRREVWEENPFHRVDFAEDSEWGDRVLRDGYKLVYEPASMVFHSHNYGLVEQLRQNFDHARGMKRLFDPPAYGEITLTGMIGGALREWPGDLRYLGSCPHLSRARKVGHLAYAPWWYLACNLGTYLGARHAALPDWLGGLLSRQGRLMRR